MNETMARRIDSLMGSAKPEDIYLGDEPMLLELYRKDGVAVLINWRHVRPFWAVSGGPGYSGIECSGVMALDSAYGDYVWRIEQEQPLALTPSLSCKRCGAHGHITKGRWVGHVPIPSADEGNRLANEYQEHGYVL